MNARAWQECDLRGRVLATGGLQCAYICTELLYTEDSQLGSEHKNIAHLEVLQDPTDQEHPA